MNDKMMIETNNKQDAADESIQLVNTSSYRLTHNYTIISLQTDAVCISFNLYGALYV